MANNEKNCQNAMKARAFYYYEEFIIALLSGASLSNQAT